MMGSVIQLKNKVNNAYLDLKNSVDDKIILVEEKIKNRLISDVSLVEKMTNYNPVSYTHLRAHET